MGKGFKDIGELQEWVRRNCRRCRKYSVKVDGGDGAGLCNAAAGAVRAIIQGRGVSDDFVRMVNRVGTWEEAVLRCYVPRVCWQRDYRGGRGRRGRMEKIG